MCSLNEEHKYQKSQKPDFWRIWTLKKSVKQHWQDPHYLDAMTVLFVSDFDWDVIEQLLACGGFNK